MKLLQGVVRDHRLPQDYKMAFTQPVSSTGFMKDLKRTFVQRLITKQYASVPMFLFFGVVVPYFVFQSWLKMKLTGSLP